MPVIFVVASSSSNNLKGRILLQVESKGEAWYIEPKSGERIYMANGDEAYNIMRTSGVGITNRDLDKLKANKLLALKQKGKIFLQVQSHGEAYYVDFKGILHYLKNGTEAYNIMRSQGLGITNKDLEKIPFKEEVSAPMNILECNKKLELVSDDIEDDDYYQGASTKAWECFSKNMYTCSPAIIYGLASLRSGEEPKEIYYKIIGFNSGHHCEVTGPKIDMLNNKISGVSCAISSEVFMEYFNSLDYPEKWFQGYNLVGHIINGADQKYCLQTVDDKINVDRQYGKINITGKEITLPTQKCYVDYNTGGSLVYWLTIDFSTSGKGNITFSVRDPKNNRDNLLVPGIHTALGEGDSYNNYLDGYSWLLEPEDMAIVLEEINMAEGSESIASGYVDIKRKITQSCADEAWIDGQNIKLGEPGYVSCGWEDLYLEPQKIYFKCSL